MHLIADSSFLSTITEVPLLSGLVHPNSSVNFRILFAFLVKCNKIWLRTGTIVLLLTFFVNHFLLFLKDGGSFCVAGGSVAN